MADGGRKIGGILLFGGLCRRGSEIPCPPQGGLAEVQGDDQVWNAEETLALARELQD